jgi:hypothetical protein
MQAVFSTRRGTNHYHGRGFVNLQNSGFDANNWYNGYNEISKQLSHKEDCGGSVGGPAWKNRIFFFCSY